MPKTPREFVREQLLAAGCNASTCDAIAGACAADDDGQRWLCCLAIDLKSGAIDPTEIAGFVNAIGAGGDPRIDFAKQLDAASAKFDACVATVIAPSGVKYASVMRLEKYARLFRGAPTTLGALGLTDLLDDLSDAGTTGIEEDSLLVDLVGFDRPITWVTNLETVAGFQASGDGAKRATEELGLTWPEGVPLQVVYVEYPASFEGSVTIGRPNLICEVWNAPGLFVSEVDKGTGWGRTAGRTKPDHSGAPERVHASVPKGTGGSWYGRLLGMVTLPKADRSLAASEALARWNNGT